EGPPYFAAPAEEADAPDDGCRDRIEQERAPALVQVHRLEPRREDDAADTGHHRRDHEHDDPNARDVDAGPPCRLGVSADGVHVATERGPFREVREADE